MEETVFKLINSKIGNNSSNNNKWTYFCLEKDSMFISCLDLNKSLLDEMTKINPIFFFVKFNQEKSKSCFSKKGKGNLF